MDETLRTLRLAARTLARAPGFTLAAVLCLTLGVGGTTAMFSIVDRILLEPAPYREPGRIVRVWDRLAGLDLPRVNASPPEYMDFQAATEIFDAVAAFLGPANVSLTGSGTPERVRAAIVAPGMFPLLGVEPAIGRGFREREAIPGNEYVVILTHGFWNRRFGGDPDVVGQTVRLNGDDHEIVGVMPEEFEFLRRDTDLFAPMTLDRDREYDRHRRYLKVYARLAPGLSVEEAQVRVDNLASRFRAEYPEIYDDKVGFGIVLEPLQEERVGEVRDALWILFGAVGLVLLVACANVANLLLARATSRKHELAIHSVLGASRGRLLLQLLAESLILSLVSSALGLGVAFAALRAIVALNPTQIPYVDVVQIHGPAVLFTLVVAVVVTLIFGLVPAIRSSRVRFNAALKEGRTSGSGRSSRFLRDFLVVGEVALALMLLVGAGLLMKSFVRLQQIDPGFVPERVLTLDLALPLENWDEPDIRGFYREVHTRLQALPGTRHAGAISSLPLKTTGSTVGFEIEGRQAGPGEERLGAEHRVVTAGYHRAMGIELIDGRYFGDADGPSAAPVVIIDEELARRYWSDRSPIGAFLRLGSDPDAPPRQIVGVVEAVRHHGLDQDLRGHIYQPHAQQPNRAMTVVLATHTAPLALAPAIRQRIWSVQSDIAISDLRPMEDVLAESFTGRRFSLWLLGMFSAVATALAALGVYGVMAYVAGERRREISIRMAVGANRKTVLNMIFRQGLLLALLGITGGVVGAVYLSHLLTALLYGITASDPATYIQGALLMALIGALATWIPGVRATRVDPSRSLRTE